MFLVSEAFFNIYFIFESIINNCCRTIQRSYIQIFASIHFSDYVFQIIRNLAYKLQPSSILEIGDNQNFESKNNVWTWITQNQNWAPRKANSYSKNEIERLIKHRMEKLNDKAGRAFLPYVPRKTNKIWTTTSKVENKNAIWTY